MFGTLNPRDERGRQLVSRKTLESVRSGADTIHRFHAWQSSLVFTVMFVCISALAGCPTHD